MGVDLHDPLTCPDWWVHEYEVCNCEAPEGAIHAWDCSVSPIYAGMDRESLSDILNEFCRANLAMTQTAIKCAECGRERLAKDLLPIYQAPVMRSDDYDGRYRYPSNIVKAVCEYHNRKGTARFVRG